MLDWLIVGGGLHGAHLALVLTRMAGVARERLRVLDPGPDPLAAWCARADAVGMEVLRSPAVHHVDLAPMSLANFARRARPVERLVGRYGRPTRAVFEAHARHSFARAQLSELWIEERATGLERTASGWRVGGQRGALEARHVVLALGPPPPAAPPAWAPQDARVQHLFAPGFARSAIAPWERLLVVGAGASGVQAALALARRSAHPVHLLARGEPSVQDFDTGPCWLGPRCLAGFSATTDLLRRRQAVRTARVRGSIPADVARALGFARRREEIVLVTAQPRAVHATPEGLCVEGRDGSRRSFDRILLATGFAQDRPTPRWLDAAIESCELPLAACGTPSLNRHLEWAPGLIATGVLAELELGPVARNLAGARMAGERLRALALAT